GNIGSVDQEYTARWLFRQATASEPGHVPSGQMWAQMEASLGDPSSAAGIIQEGIDQCGDTPALTPALRELEIRARPIGAGAQVERLLQAGEWTAAENLLRAALTRGPQDAELHMLVERWAGFWSDEPFLDPVIATGAIPGINENPFEE